MQAPFILADTWFSSILLDKDSSFDRVIKVKLVFSKWRDNITSLYSQFELVILKKVVYSKLLSNLFTRLSGLCPIQVCASRTIT